MPLPMARDSFVAELSGGAAAGAGRSAVRTDLGVGGQVTDWFGLELRSQYLHVAEHKGTDESGRRASHTVNAFQPYLRPFFFAGPVTFAVPLSGFAFGGGGGGIAAGMAGASIAVGGARWNVFTGVQWQAAEITSSNHSESSAREVCFGGRYALLGDVWRVSIDPQLVWSRHHMSYSSGGDDGSGPSSTFTSDRQLVMGLLQLSVGFGDLRQKKAVPPVVPAPARHQYTPPLDRCRDFCEAQRHLPCGMDAHLCRDACARREIPPVCVSQGDELLRCEAGGLSCEGSRLVFPPCAAQRRALDECRLAGVAR